jgi:CheY-like chemotaxis protein
MVDLINDILDIAKIEAGQLILEVTDYALRETIEQACTSAGTALQAKGVAFELEIADSVPEQTRGDGRRLRQILLNLVSNAVKFTSEGKVTVRATMRRSRGSDAVLRVEVSDTGIGIEPSIMDQVFEPFTQADASTTRHYGGSGLGLAISRELAELLGGTIGADSKPGVGSTFWLELPLSAPAATDDQLLAPTPTGLAERALWSTPPLVLVAEDNVVNQIVAARTLERCGCHADVVADGREALEALAARHYDAVLMDCQMPVMDGYEATTDLRRREGDAEHTPVIAMTAHAMNGAVEKCMAAGMDDYIAKPMRRAQLIDILRAWIPPQDDPAGTNEPVANRT